jgi:hypothetical protein
MAERLFFGRSGGDFRVRISRAGFDARTASPENLVLSEQMLATQIIARGSAAGAGVPTAITVNFPTQPARPMVIIRWRRFAAPNPVLYPTETEEAYNDVGYDVTTSSFSIYDPGNQYAFSTLFYTVFGTRLV